MRQFERYRWQDHVVRPRSWLADLTFLALVLSLLAAASMLERSLRDGGDGPHYRAHIGVTAPSSNLGIAGRWSGRQTEG